MAKSPNSKSNPHPFLCCFGFSGKHRRFKPLKPAAAHRKGPISWMRFHSKQPPPSPSPSVQFNLSNTDSDRLSSKSISPTAAFNSNEDFTVAVPVATNRAGGEIVTRPENILINSKTRVVSIGSVRSTRLTDDKKESEIHQPAFTHHITPPASHKPSQGTASEYAGRVKAKQRRDEAKVPIDGGNVNFDDNVGDHGSVGKTMCHFMHGSLDCYGYELKKVRASFGSTGCPFTTATRHSRGPPLKAVNRYADSLMNRPSFIHLSESFRLGIHRPPRPESDGASEIAACKYSIFLISSGLNTNESNRNSLVGSLVLGLRLRRRGEFSLPCLNHVLCKFVDGLYRLLQLLLHSQVQIV
ncbi:hypothetical protein SDJN03_26355, partial [Cucurbita argyrosperma subsp. sororia]